MTTTPTYKPETLPAGLKLGAFQIISPLNASGGMANVYLAEVRERYRREGLPVRVALKVAKANYEDFLRTEAAILAKMSEHPNLVKIFPMPGETAQLFWKADSVTTDRLRNERLCFLAMEYVEGVSLRKYLERGGRLSNGLAWGIAQQIAAGLKHAHTSAIVHLDLKPENILLRRRRLNSLRSSAPQVVVCDFGIARDLNSHARIERAGSPDYAAPEVFLEADSRHATVSFPADVYMLGEILYEMLAGHLPFDDASPKIAGLLPPPIETVNPHVPAELSKIVTQALAHDPVYRYARAQDILHALERVSVGPDAALIARQAAAGVAVAGLLSGAVWGGSLILSLTRVTPTPPPIVTMTPSPKSVTASPTKTPTVKKTATLRPTSAPISRTSGFAPTR
jgi:eukaryotic-like serine/threonine-protein kinase